MMAPKTRKWIDASMAIRQTEEYRDACRQAQLIRYSDPAQRAAASALFSGPGNPRWQQDRAHLSERQEYERVVRGSLKQAKKRLFNGDLDFYIEELGYTARQLREHLEVQFLIGMSWENWGEVWQIDHIIPVSRHDVTALAHVVNALSNLRPL